MDNDVTIQRVSHSELLLAEVALIPLDLLMSPAMMVQESLFPSKLHPADLADLLDAQVLLSHVPFQICISEKLFVAQLAVKAIVLFQVMTGNMIAQGTAMDRLKGGRTHSCDLK